MRRPLHNEVHQRTKASKAVVRDRKTLQRLLHVSENERRLIAYEIHDGLAQYLTASILHFQSFQAFQDQDTGAAAGAFERGMAFLQKSVTEARRLIGSVRSPLVDERGIDAAIAQLVHAYQGPDSPRIEFRSKMGSGSLDPTIASAIFRIAQGALANACKHSKSERVRISLTRHQQRLVRLVIQDWGIGFDLTQSREGRFGLEGIRERVRLLGGRVTIDSVPGEGTCVRAELPVVERPPHDVVTDTMDHGAW